MHRTVAVVLPRHVVAFEGAGNEKQLSKRIQRQLKSTCDDADVNCSRVRRLSLSISDWKLYRFLHFIITSTVYPHEFHGTLRQLLSFITIQFDAEATVEQHLSTCIQYPFMDGMLFEAKGTQRNNSEATSQLWLAAVIYRPDPLLPFCMASARRAVRFVHGVVALVTANAYISTLGGGHFLCKHLNQAKLMARLQIAVSMGLQDPVLESKCRINLAYNAMQAGKFRRAYKIILRETDVAKELANEELEKVCHAAKVYLFKNYRLHKEFLRNVPDSATSTIVMDNFYRQRIVRTAT